MSEDNYSLKNSEYMTCWLYFYVHKRKKELTSPRIGDSLRLAADSLGCFEKLAGVVRLSDPVTKESSSSILGVSNSGITWFGTVSLALFIDGFELGFEFESGFEFKLLGVVGWISWSLFWRMLEFESGFEFKLLGVVGWFWKLWFWRLWFVDIAAGAEDFGFFTAFLFVISSFLFFIIIRFLFS